MLHSFKMQKIPILECDREVIYEKIAPAGVKDLCRKVRRI